MTSPSPTTPGRVPPMSTRARILVTLGIVFALGLFVLAGLRTDDDPGQIITAPGVPAENALGAPANTNTDGIEAFVPPDGDAIFGQDQFGIDLEPAWLGEITLLSNGAEIAIPAEQLEPSTQNAFIYDPRQPEDGEERIVERLAGGPNCVRAVIWSQLEGRERSERTVEWCFTVL